MERLKPLIDMLNNQEERIVRKIDDVHGDVKRINGRLRRNEGKVIRLEDEVDDINEKLDDIKPAVSSLRNAQYIFKHPFKCAVIAVGSIIVIQLVIQNAIEQQWLHKLISALKLIT